MIENKEYPLNSTKLKVGLDYMQYSEKYRRPFNKNFQSIINIDNEQVYSKPENMYTPKRSYQQGGQPQPQDEMQMVEAILQAISQLSPEGQQMLMEQLQGGGQEAPPEEQGYMPPQQRMGGRFN